MIDPLESWIGKTIIRHDVVTRRILDEFNATLSPHLFSPSNVNHCPPGLHWCLALPAPPYSGLALDGTEAKGDFLPPVPLPRRMWAGGQIETFGPIIADSAVSRTSSVSSVRMREGKAGPLCFITVTHDIESAGNLVVRERHELVFHDAVRPQQTPPAGKHLPEGEIVWQIDASPVLLFRFSAITFNGHRIHYDLGYAKKTEGYPGLLVHGPLQAALLLNQLSVLRGAVPPVFSYRCVAPLIAPGTVHVASRKGEAGEDSGVIADANGIVTIEATARE